MSAPRQWTGDELRARFAALARDAERPVRCTAPGGGSGICLNLRDGERRGSARIDIQVEPAETLTIRLEHAWPSEREPAHGQEFDERILQGLCEALARGRADARFGRIVARSVVDYGTESTPVAFQVAAAMAVQDAIRRGGWDPGDPTDETVAIFGRRRA
jgi:hypothetical protein